MTITAQEVRDLLVFRREHDDIDALAMRIADDSWLAQCLLYESDAMVWHAWRDAGGVPSLVNLTPHAVVLFADDGETIIATIPPDGRQVRLVEIPGPEQEWGLPVPVRSPSQYGEAQGLPEWDAGTLLIVPLMVAQHVQRADLVSPSWAAGDVVRDAQGRQIGTRRLIAAI